MDGLPTVCSIKLGKTCQTCDRPIEFVSVDEGRFLDYPRKDGGYPSEMRVFADLHENRVFLKGSN